MGSSCDRTACCIGSRKDGVTAPFHYCVITASTPEQAASYEAAIESRVHSGLYPVGLQFRVYSDPLKGRVGSGGGTLVALRELFAQEVGAPAFLAEGADEDGLRAFFGSKRVLVLHAGGESRRLPCYVPEGKLFGPLSAAPGSDGIAGHPPVVLDIVLSLYFTYPWADGEVIMASGDVIVNFDVRKFARPECPFDRGDICGFGCAALLEQGSRHGVFAFGSVDAGDPASATLPVKDFHQKSPVSVLEAECLVPGTADKCALDMGIFSMSVEWCVALFRFASTPSGDGGATVMDAVAASGLYFDFYLEVVTACLPGQPLQAYLGRMAGQSKLPAPVLESMHRCMQGLRLRGALVSDSLFLHFGTLLEFPLASAELRRHDLAPFYRPSTGAAGAEAASEAPEEDLVFVNCDPGNVRVSRQGDGGTTCQPAWIEMCSGLDATLSPTGFHMIVGLENVSLPRPLPAGICLDARSVASLAPAGKQIVLVYSVADSFKRAKAPAEVTFCGARFPEWLADRGLAAGDVWSDADEANAATDLWTAKLFCEYSSAEFLEGYWDRAHFSSAEFLRSPRFSIGDLNRHDSLQARDEVRTTLFRNNCAVMQLQPINQ